MRGLRYLLRNAIIAEHENRRYWPADGRLESSLTPRQRGTCIIGASKLFHNCRRRKCHQYSRP